MSKPTRRTFLPQCLLRRRGPHGTRMMKLSKSNKRKRLPRPRPWPSGPPALGAATRGVLPPPGCVRSRCAHRCWGSTFALRRHYKTRQFGCALPNAFMLRGRWSGHHAHTALSGASVRIHAVRKGPPLQWEDSELQPSKLGSDPPSFPIRTTCYML